MTKEPFYSALTLANDLYGVEIDEDLFETFGLNAWRKIGNKDYKMYVVKLYPQADCDGGWYICKPCNLDEIEAITLNHEYAQETSPVNEYIGFENHATELYIEARKHGHNRLYIPGEYVKYQELGDRIYFTEPYKSVNLLYKGIYADEDGLPLLNDKEKEAIATYCAYAYNRRLGFIEKDKGYLEIALMLELSWKRQCDQARLPMSISLNSMNEILNAATSWNRHQYSLSTKPVF